MVPKLWTNHPNFFMVYFTTAVIFHLGLGLTQLVEQDRYNNPSLSKVYDVLPVGAWGIGSLIVVAFMVLGFWYKFELWGWLGLGLGLFICLSRGLLIEISQASGGGIFVWGSFAIFHLSQLSEPPVNPLTAKE